MKRDTITLSDRGREILATGDKLGSAIESDTVCAAYRAKRSREDAALALAAFNPKERIRQSHEAIESVRRTQIEQEQVRFDKLCSDFWWGVAGILCVVITFILARY